MDNQAPALAVTFDADGFKSRLAQVITATGLNQTEFSRHLGISSGFMSDLVRGQKRPGSDFLFGVKAVFGVSIDWLLTGTGSQGGTTGIDIPLLRTIRLLVAIARAAIISDNPTARALLLVVRDGQLDAATSDPTLRTFIDQLQPQGDDFDLVIELYNGHLWSDAEAQRRNVLASAITHFEARKPVDNMTVLTHKIGSTLQINIGGSQQIAGKKHKK